MMNIELTIDISNGYIRIGVFDFLINFDIMESWLFDFSILHSVAFPSLIFKLGLAVG